ncbi:hypothetical protein B0H13DRAFT_2374189 [Mycena leptocephala]|nr:hypothetical protein B0H13DRAFT_2374189 [Mycena leptocephala]
MSAPASRGRVGRKASTISNKKRPAADTVADDESTEAKKPAPKKKKIAIPLPRRSPSKPQVALAAKSKEDQLAQMKYARDVAVAAYAALEAEQEAATAAEERDAILDYDPAAHSDADLLTITDDDFTRLENNQVYGSDDDFVPAAKKVSKGKAKAKTVKKYAKGELKASIEEQIQQQKFAEASTGTSSQTANVARKKLKGVQNSAASDKAGVNPKFSLKFFENVVDRFPTKAPSLPSSPSLGGLQDADTRPAFVAKNEATPVRFFKNEMAEMAGPSKVARKNELILIEDDSEEDFKVTRLKAKTVKAEPISRLPALGLSLHQKSSATVFKHKPAPKPKVIVPPVPSFTPHTPAVSPNALPAFVADKWATKVMPTLHRALNDSDTPWELGVQNDYTLKTVQKIIDNACPGNTYTVKWNDPIVRRASQRLSERRSAVGTNAVDVVAKYIAANDVEYSTRQEIQAYARYALNPAGRPFVDKRDPKYVKPKGLFESEFIIAVAAPLLKVGGSKFPYGAIGLATDRLRSSLAAAAVERAWYKHLASTEDAAKFSKERTGTAVDGYVATAHKLSENAWQRIIDACNEHTAQAVETVVEDTDLSLDGLREDLYEPSSP